MKHLLPLSFTLVLALNGRAADWPQYHGPALDGTTTESLKTTRFPEGGPKALWREPMENGFSSFSVANGRAYTQITRNMDGLDQEVVICVDANTGKELWAQAVGIKKYDGGGDSGADGNKGGDGPRSTPSVNDGRVYVLSSDLVISCYDAASGKEIWKRDIIKDFKGSNITWKNAASPVVDGDLVFAAGGGKDEALLAFNKKDGTVVWKTQSDTITHATPTIAEIHGVRQIIFFTQSGLVSLEPATGKVLWRQEFPFRVSTAASPVVSGSMVYCSAGYGVGAATYRISKQGDEWTSKEMWFSKGNSPVVNHWSTPVQKNGFLFGMFSFKEYGDGPMKCVDMATGKVLWEKGGFGPGNVILAEEKLIALGDAGQLVIVEANANEYRELARADVVDGKCWSTPVLSNGRIYVRSTKEGACLDVGGQ